MPNDQSSPFGDHVPHALFLSQLKLDFCELMLPYLVHSILSTAPTLAPRSALSRGFQVRSLVAPFFSGRTLSLADAKRCTNCCWHDPEVKSI